MSHLLRIVAISLPALILGAACAPAFAHGVPAETQAQLLHSVSMHGTFVPPVAEQIVAQARRCLSLSADASRGSFRVELAVAFEGGVAAEIRVAELDPPGRVGRSIVDAATRAIVRCGPYSGVDDGEIIVVIESEE